MAEVRIRVLAVADPGLRSAFLPLEQASARARARVVGDARAMSAAQERELQRSMRSKLRMADDSARDAGRRAEAEGRAVLRAREQAMRSELRMFDERLRASRRAREAEERDILRTADRAQRRDQRRAAGGDAGQRTHLAHDFGRRAVSNLGAMARGSIGIAGEFARGAGVDFSVQSLVSRNVQLERMATELSNAGYKPGGQRVAPAEIASQIRGASDAAGMDRANTAEGLQAFVGKTGELEAGLGMLRELAVLSKATGTEMRDMTDAAGDVYNALDSIADPTKRMERTQQVMRAIAGQGKVGAVEIKDLASQMAKLGTSATAFEGQAGENVALMGAFAQMARAKGGAASATQAATSVSALVNTFRTPARMAAFKAEGIEVANKTTGMLRNPQEILMQALSKTQGDPERFKKLFANVQGARAVEGFATSYRMARASALEKGATKEQANAAGLKAVEQEFDRLKKIAMGQGEIADSFAARMQNADSKAQLFQNRLEDVAGSLVEKLAPALERAAPGLIAMADALAGVVAWAAENPGKAITAAIVASIGKAGLETVVRGALEGAVKKGGSASPVTTGANGGMSNLAAAVAITAAAVSITATGIALIDAENDRRDNADAASRRRRTDAGIDVDRALSRAERGVATQEDLAALKAREAELQAQIDMAQNAPGPLGTTARFGRDALNWVTGAGPSFDATQGEYDAKRNLDANEKALAEVRGAIQALGGQTLAVRVTNAAEIRQNGPNVDPNARTGPGGE